MQDYKTYLDFVLALENRKEPQSLAYLFRLLDIDGKGYLNEFDLNYFFRVCLTLVTVVLYCNGAADVGHVSRVYVCIAGHPAANEKPRTRARRV